MRYNAPTHISIVLRDILLRLANVADPAESEKRLAILKRDGWLS